MVFPIPLQKEISVPGRCFIFLATLQGLGRHHKPWNTYSFSLYIYLYIYVYWGICLDGFDGHVDIKRWPQKPFAWAGQELYHTSSSVAGSKMKEGKAGKRGKVCSMVWTQIFGPRPSSLLIIIVGFKWLSAQSLPLLPWCPLLNRKKGHAAFSRVSSIEKR